MDRTDLRDMGSFWFWVLGAGLCVLLLVGIWGLAGLAARPAVNDAVYNADRHSTGFVVAKQNLLSQRAADVARLDGEIEGLRVQNEGGRYNGLIEQKQSQRAAVVASMRREADTIRYDQVPAEAQKYLS